MWRRALACLATTCAASFGHVARAQVPDGDRSDEPDPAAVALFRDGRERLANGDWTGACQKFDASLARFVSASILINVAKCHEHFGRTASAAAAYERALSSNASTVPEARKRALEEIVRERLAAIGSRVPRVTVRVSPAASARVTLDGKELPTGEPLPMDPGPHDLVVTAPGRVATRRELVLREGESQVIEMDLPAATDEAARAPAGTIGATEAPAEAPSTGRAGPPAWAWIPLGAGAVAGALSVAFTIDALDARSDLEDVCGPDLVCDAPKGEAFSNAEPLNERKARDIGLAIGLGAAGLLGTGVGVIALLVAPRAPSRAGVELVPASRGASAGLSIRLPL